jgi:hypothetical protein
MSSILESFYNEFNEKRQLQAELERYRARFGPLDSRPDFEVEEIDHDEDDGSDTEQE